MYIWNSHKHIWEPGKIFSHPHPNREKRTYIVEKNGKLYQRTREHLRSRGTNKVPPTQTKECHLSPPSSCVLPESVLDYPTEPPATALINADSDPDLVTPASQPKVTLTVRSTFTSQGSKTRESTSAKARNWSHCHLRNHKNHWFRLQVDVLTVVIWTLYDFIPRLFEALFHADLMKVPHFLAVLALGMDCQACGINVMLISTSKAATVFEFELWFTSRWTMGLESIAWTSLLSLYYLIVLRLSGYLPSFCF